MENQPATNPSRSPLARLWPWLMVLVVLLFVAYIRVRLLEMPLERDEGEYAYAGQLILHGVPPYELAYNMKLPGTYFACAFGMAVFGQTISGVHLTLIVANSLTIIFVFLLARKLFGVTAGLVAGASYSVMSVSPSVLGMAAHANHFVVLFAVPATLLLWKAGESGCRKTLFFSGLLYGLAFLMKQQGMFFILFGWIFLVWQAKRNKHIFSSGFAKTCLPFGLGAVLPFVLTCLVLACAGVFPKFWFWTFTYARSYVTSMPWLEGTQHLGQHLQQTFNVSLGFWVIAAAGLPLAYFNKAARSQTTFTVVFWLCSFLGVATGLYFRSHYFILVLPAFALLIGVAVSSMQLALRFPRLQDVLKSLPLILFATILSWVVFYQWQFFFQMPPSRICQTLYPGNPFEESLAAGNYIREHSAADERIAVVGSEPEIYFYAQRRSATGYIYTYALMEQQPNALKMQHEMIAEIETNKPEYLVHVSYRLSWLFQPHSDRAILGWLDEYAGGFYEQVGFVHRNSAGEVESIWGAAATNHHNDAGKFIAVFKRKAALETVPARTN